MLPLIFQHENSTITVAHRVVQKVTYIACMPTFTANIRSRLNSTPVELMRTNQRIQRGAVVFICTADLPVSSCEYRTSEESATITQLLCAVTTRVARGRHCSRTALVLLFTGCYRLQWTEQCLKMTQYKKNQFIVRRNMISGEAVGRFGSSNTIYLTTRRASW